MKIYIHTIPKAGTYFLADFIARLGFHNTGYHVSRTDVLDTAKFDLETNASYPSRAMVKQPFMRTLREMKDGDLAFGHFPAPLMSWLFPDFFFVSSYRHPRHTLTSEFVDFRFRRKDIPVSSRAQIPDDRDAFCAYLKQNGESHIAFFSDMLAITILRNEALCTRFQTDQFHMLNFDALLNNPQAAIELAGRLGASPAQAVDALEQTKNAETKTKATGLAVDRAALWSDRAEKLYQQTNAEAYVKRGRELGWTI